DSGAKGGDSLGGGAKSESLGGKSDSLGDSSRSELGGWDGLSGYAGPSFSEYVGNDVDLDGSSFSGGLWDGSPGGGGAHPGPNKAGQNAKANADYEKGQQQAMDTLNQAGVQAGKKADALAGELAQEQAQFDASLQAKRDRKAAEEGQRDRQRRASLETIREGSPLTDTVDPKANPGMPAANTKKDKDEDGVLDTLKEIFDAAGKAVKKTNDVLQGDENNAIKFGSYVSTENQSFYNTMMDYTKKATIKGARRGARQYGPVGSLLAPVAAAGGMLTGTIVGINNMKNE
ncbi:MAG TPA: hypothetical protein DCS48_07865, partial [Desulfovibrio sp.]|nr:hypothetical protein [Desulfovibrio sp.]